LLRRIPKIDNKIRERSEYEKVCYQANRDRDAHMCRLLTIYRLIERVLLLPRSREVF